MKMTLNKKEYEMGKITRGKHSKFAKVYKDLEDKANGFYEDEDLDKMVEVIVDVFDNQFTIDDVNEHMEISDIIFNFMSIQIEIGEKLNNKIQKANKVFTGKK